MEEDQDFLLNERLLKLEHLIDDLKIIEKVIRNDILNIEDDIFYLNIKKKENKKNDIYK